MANNLHWSSDDLKKRGLVQDASGNYVPVKSLAKKGKVEKMANLLERAIQPDKIIIEQSGPAFNNKLLQGRINEINAQEAFDTLSGKNKEIVLPHVAMKKFIEQGFAEIKATANKKVRNSVKSTNAEGVKFDSNLEKHMYNLLKGAKIYFNFQVPYVLQEKFAYGTENIRAITLTVDFFLPGKNMIIDTKGMQTQQGAMRYKMLKKHFVDTQPDNLPVIELPATKGECDLLLNRLLYQS